MNNETQKVTTFKMTTYTLTGSVFKTAIYKSTKTMWRAKIRQDLEYGCSLRAEAFEIDSNGNVIKSVWPN